MEVRICGFLVPLLSPGLLFVTFTMEGRFLETPLPVVVVAGSLVGAKEGGLEVRLFCASAFRVLDAGSLMGIKEGGWDETRLRTFTFTFLGLSTSTGKLMDPLPFLELSTGKLMDPLAFLGLSIGKLMDPLTDALPFFCLVEVRFFGSSTLRVLFPGSLTDPITFFCFVDTRFCGFTFWVCGSGMGSIQLWSGLGFV